MSNNSDNDFNANKEHAGANPGNTSAGKEKENNESLDELGMQEDGKNLGAGPIDIKNGGVPGEAKQPKEHTGNMTEMGGDKETAAKRIPDASEGNSNGLASDKQ